MPAIDRKLTPAQNSFIDRWLPGHEIVADHSWGHGLTAVFELTHNGKRYVAKAGHDSDTHIARELHAHRHWLTPWTSRRLAPLLIHASSGAKLLVTQYQPGVLVEGSDHELAQDTYRQAGELLALMHGQLSQSDAHYAQRQKDKALAWLDRPHRIALDVVDQLRDEISTWPVQPTVVVPTHGDWQPRNWLIDRGRVSVIDFGRAELRPAHTDLARLCAQQFRTEPQLEAAFLEGYGHDPREPGQWRRTRIAEAIGTACWAHQVGDKEFEQQGHEMLAEALAA